MPSSACELLGMYLHLARAAEIRRRLLVRDKVMVLAAAMAQEMRLPAVAEHCRRKVLAHNPGHLIGRYGSVDAALKADDFAGYANHLRREFPLEKVEHMLASLNITWDGERAAYYSDEEYAAALLGVTTERLGEPGPSMPLVASPAGQQPTRALPASIRSAWGVALVAVALLLTLGVVAWMVVTRL